MQYKAGAHHETVVYEVRNDNPLKLLVVKPYQFRTKERRTAFVWIHGGGWEGGEPEQFLPHCYYFAERGAIAFSIQCRLRPRGATRDSSYKEGKASTIYDCLADYQSAVRYTRQHAEELGIAPDRIVIEGDSAGGNLAACLACRIPSSSELS